VGLDVQVLSSDGGRKSGKGDELVLHVDGNVVVEGERLVYESR